MLAAQSLSLGHRGVMVAGGFESMSNVPYYLPKARNGLRLGNSTVVDGETAVMYRVLCIRTVPRVRRTGAGTDIIV